MSERRTGTVHHLFRIGIYLKGINGILELIGGTLFFFIRPELLNTIVQKFTQGELSEDPNDVIATFLVQSAHRFSIGSEIYGGIFLLSHGLIKCGLVLALFKKKRWAYPLAITIFALFIMYQMYKYSLSHSIWMLTLSLLDLFVIILTWLEYRSMKRD
jgi:uncharacterized membrane protein